MKKLLGMGLAIVSFGLMLPLTASAACLITGQVVRVYDTATVTNAFLKTSSLSTIYYSTVTTDSDLRDAPARL